MLLRTRLALLVISSLLIVSSVFAVIQWQREIRFEERYSAFLLLGQEVAWNKIVARYTASITEVATQLIADKALRSAIDKGDKTAYVATIDQYVQKHPDLRIDLFNSAGVMLYTTSTDMNLSPLVDKSGLMNLRKSGQGLTGVWQLDARHFQLITATDLGPGGNSIGIVAVGRGFAGALKELKQNFGADAFILNLHGRLTDGTDNALWQSTKRSPSLRNAGVVRGRVGEKTYLAASQPLINPYGKTIGAVVTLRDTTAESKSDEAFALVWFSIGAGLVLLLAVALFIYVRISLNPLNRAVDVLNALAKGDTSARLPNENDERTDEAGDIAQGVVLLRDEMVNFSMLRDERIRQNKRQEQLIRKQLVGLAGTLDQQQRDKIISDLEVALQEARDGKGNQLATLAAFLGQMSALITDQHADLVQLVEEVKAGAETKAKYAGLQQELEIARNMQASILPRDFPSRREVNLSATMIPAKEVGGDFYDYFYLDDTRLGLVVADVSGKGVAAAFFMAVTRTLLRATALFMHKPSECMERLNDILSSENEQMMFVTTFYGVLDLKTGKFEYVNAGHNPPILWNGNKFSTLPSTNGIALAVADGMSFSSHTVQLEQDDTLIFFTDGVTEANDVDEVLFGDLRLEQAVRSMPANVAVDEIPGRLVKSVKGFAGKAPQADDITCLAVRFLHHSTQA